jgi:hypothetical protein
VEKQTIHTDCFAFNESENTKEQCCALTERICNYRDCHFYKDDCSNDTKKLIREQKDLFEKV